MVISALRSNDDREPFEMSMNELQRKKMTNQRRKKRSKYIYSDTYVALLVSARKNQ